MGAVMESLFSIAYLITGAVFAVLILRKSKGNKQAVLFGAAIALLVAGDSFHLVPRIYALLTDGTENHAAALGIGTLITSLTMTVFYLLLYIIYKARYRVKRDMSTDVLVCALAAIRIISCILPQNDWTNPDAPYYMGILRNIPFLALGIVMIVLFFKKRREDRPLRFLWLAITLSFAFYLPVVLFADFLPVIGMLMLPKTVMYVWMMTMARRALLIQN